MEIINGRIHRSVEEWQIVIDLFETRGSSPSVFCKEEGISESALYKWRKRLGSKMLRKVEFIEAKEPLVAKEEVFEVVLKCGRSLVVKNTFNAVLLSELIRVVERC